MAFESLAFSIQNGEEKNELYFGSTNHLKLVVELKGGTDDTNVVFSSGSEIQLDGLQQFLSSDLMDQITVGDGWNVSVEGGELLLTPTERFELTVDSPQIFLEMAVIVGEETDEKNPTLEFSYSDVEGVSSTPFRLNLQLLLPPDEDKGDLRDVIEAGYTGEGGTLQLAVTDNGEPLVQEFGFYLQNLSGSEPIEAGDNTHFIVSFTTTVDSNDPGQGALASLQDVSLFVLASGQGANDWEVQSNTDANNPTWTLSPPSGQPILGSGSSASAVFEFSKVVSHLVPGLTRMDIRYENVPGYNDGYFALAINKNPRVQIHNFEASPSPVVGIGGTVLLRWQAEHFQTLHLEGAPSETKSETALPRINVTDTTERNWPIAGNTEFQFTAQGVPEINNKTETLMVKCLVPPVIERFEIEPSDLIENSEEVTVSWKVVGAEKVFLDEKPVNSNDSTTVQIESQNYSSNLVAESDDLSTSEHVIASNYFVPGNEIKHRVASIVDTSTGKLFSTDGSRQIFIDNLDTLAPEKEVELDAAISKLVRRPGDNFLHALAEDHSRLTLIDLSNMKQKEYGEMYDFYRWFDLVVHPESKFLYCAGLGRNGISISPGVVNGETFNFQLFQEFSRLNSRYEVDWGFGKDFFIANTIEDEFIHIFYFSLLERTPRVRILDSRS